MSTSSSSSSVYSTSSTMAQKFAPKKDYEAAFGALASTYGTSGFVPSPIPKSSSGSQSKTKSTSASGTSQRATAPSQMTTRPASSQTPRDYEAAFGRLSSAFGFGSSMVPVPTPADSRQSYSLRSTPTQSKPSSATSSSSGRSSKKNFESASGALQSSYGSGGQPTMLPRA